MKVVVIGATGGLGRCLAYREAELGHDLFLSATDMRDLLAMKSDIELRYKVKVDTAVLNMAKAEAALGIPVNYDRFHFPVGLSLEEDSFNLQLDQAVKLMNVNFLSIALFVAKLVATKGQRPVDVIGYGSIAQARGRSRNIFYSTAKRALTSYFESLLHAEEQEHVRAHLVQLGYLESQQSLGKKLLFPSVAPERVAKAVIERVQVGRTGIYYFPQYWFLVCLALRMLPWKVYRKLRF